MIGSKNKLGKAKKLIIKQDKARKNYKKKKGVTCS